MGGPTAWIVCSLGHVNQDMLECLFEWMDGWKYQMTLEMLIMIAPLSAITAPAKDVLIHLKTCLRKWFTLIIKLTPNEKALNYLVRVKL